MKDLEIQAKKVILKKPSFQLKSLTVWDMETIRVNTIRFNGDADTTTEWVLDFMSEDDARTFASKVENNTSEFVKRN